MRLRDYLSYQRKLGFGALPPDERPYLFDRDGMLRHDRAQSSDRAALIDDFVWPHWLPRADMGDYFMYFLVGATGNNAPLHLHSDGFNALVFGRKLWTLYNSSTTPPGYPAPSVRGHYSWLQNVLPRLPQSDQPLLCVQEAGTYRLCL